MKYKDFWSIYFTIWRILLIFYLTHSCIYLFNYHHLYYLSETSSFLPMFPLLILNDCCSDGIIVEASDVFGYRVWCYHPVEHPVELVICILPVCILPDYFIGILVSSLLVLSRCWFAVVVSRRDNIPSAEARRPTHCDRYLYCSDRRVVGVSLQLSRQCVADPWW